MGPKSCWGRMGPKSGWGRIWDRKVAGIEWDRKVVGAQWGREVVGVEWDRKVAGVDWDRIGTSVSDRHIMIEIFCIRHSLTIKSAKTCWVAPWERKQQSKESARRLTPILLNSATAHLKPNSRSLVDVISPFGQRKRRVNEDESSTPMI